MNLRALKLRNTVVDGVEVAPPACIVCGQPRPDGENVPGWHYLSGSTPLGAIACSPRCAEKAIDRHQRTGRVDTPSMRVQQ